MHRVRMSVLENQLSDPARVTRAHYREMLETRGKGWVYEVAGGEPRETESNALVGFAIADNSTRSVWALFVEPGYEGRGIGRALHDVMIEWLFEAGEAPLWLTTDAGTRAARFYLAAGWKPDEGIDPSRRTGEARFTLTAPRSRIGR